MNSRLALSVWVQSQLGAFRTELPVTELDGAEWCALEMLENFGAREVHLGLSHVGLVGATRLPGGTPLESPTDLEIDLAEDWAQWWLGEGLGDDVTVDANGRLASDDDFEEEGIEDDLLEELDGEHD